MKNFKTKQICSNYKSSTKPTGKGLVQQFMNRTFHIFTYHMAGNNNRNNNIDEIASKLH